MNLHKLNPINKIALSEQLVQIKGNNKNLSLLLSFHIHIKTNFIRR